MTTRHAVAPQERRGIRIRIARGRWLSALLGALVVLGLSSVANPVSLHASAAPHSLAAKPKVVLAFQTMIGNSGPYTGTNGTLRGIQAGGVPWKITSGAGELTANGHIVVVVRGLTLLNGMNPVSQFKAAVSCQSISNGQADVSNVFTRPFTATVTGNAFISDTVTLPTPCFAPLIFITSPSPSWFAVTGT